MKKSPVLVLVSAEDIVERLARVFSDDIYHKWAHGACWVDDKFWNGEFRWFEAERLAFWDAVWLCDKEVQKLVPGLSGRIQLLVPGTGVNYQIRRTVAGKEITFESVLNDATYVTRNIFDVFRKFLIESFIDDSGVDGVGEGFMGSGSIGVEKLTTG